MQSPFVVDTVHEMEPFARAGIFRRNQRTSNPRGLSFLPAGTHSVRETNLIRKTALLYLNIRPENLRLIHQVHSDNVVYRGDNDDGAAVIPAADAHWTDQKGLLLLIHVADCCPVVVTSERAGLAGIAHVGWRGASLGLAARLVTHMKNASSSRLSDFMVWIGPCAEAERYEVGPEFARYFSDYPGVLTPHPDRSGRFRFDIKRTIREDLLRVGVSPERVLTHTGGTIGDSRYHSHRRDGFAAGRMAVFITIGR